MLRPSLFKTAALGTVLASSLMLGSSNASLAQGTADSYSAHIVAGSCETISTTSVAQLDDVRARGTGTHQGATTAQTILSSDTDDDNLGIGLQALLAEPHAIVVTTDLSDSAAAVACGDIGGVLDDDDDDNDGDLVIALSPVNDSGSFGIAELDGDDDDDELEVQIHLAAPGA